jgi:hypothetical protein
MPERSLFDRLQAYRANPDPHGLVAILKAASNGAAQAVQGSIDATKTPRRRRFDKTKGVNSAR